VSRFCLTVTRPFGPERALSVRNKRVHPGKTGRCRSEADFVPDAASFQKGPQDPGTGPTPQKISARVPRVFWLNALAEWLLGQKEKVPQRLRSLIMLRTAVRVGCPF
jgi:hypothetical protein